MPKLSKRAAAITATAAVVVGGVGAAAYAAGWLVDGTATASAETSSIQDMTATITLNDKVFPGRQLTATATFNNPNDFNVAVDNVKLNTVSFQARHLSNDAVNTACQTSLSVNSVVLGAPVGNNVITAKTDWQQLTIPVTIKDTLSRDCAASKLTMTVDFTGTSA